MTSVGSPGSPILEGVIFDLDGVLTDTESLHQAAWQWLFDELLTGYPGARPFTGSDYRRYVEGRQPAEAIRAVLASRGVELDTDGSVERSDRATPGTLERRRDAYYLELIQQHGPRAFASSTTLVRALRRQGIATAVVTSSRHCAQVLSAAGLTQLLDAQVDGCDAIRFNLVGAPELAMLMEAARRLGIPPERTAVVMDSVSGIRAARRGGFALSVGVDRLGSPESFVRAGASAIVVDLSGLMIEPAGPGRVRLISAELAKPHSSPVLAGAEEWLWSYDGLDTAHEGIREALCTLGNGYTATRGAAPEFRHDDVHYPGTYIAGCYNRLLTSHNDGEMENESLVNVPNWLVMQVRIGDGDWLNPGTAQVSAYWQEVDMRRGVFRRQMSLTDDSQRRTLLAERRIVSMAQPHLAAQEFAITATDWSGELTLLTGLDAGIANLNVSADRGFTSRHLVDSVGVSIDGETVGMQVQTSQSRIHIHQALRVRVSVDGRAIPAERRLVDRPGFIGQELRVELHDGETLTIEKVASLYTSRDPAISEPGHAAAKALEFSADFENLLSSHVAAWDRLWSRFHFEVGHSRARRILRLHAFHALQTLSRHTMELDVGVPARGLHGEGYRGHVFWDDVLVLPLLTYRLPELTEELIGYRFRRLDRARRLASERGYNGALFPWQSGSDGREETPTRIFNPRSGRWFADHSSLQRHVNLAIAYEVWQHYEVTDDIEFLSNYGAELLIEITRFFASLAVFNADRGRYEIRSVMGPDEYHDGYPGASRPGIDNNAYTNVMVVWLMRRAIDLLSVLHGYYCDELVAALGVEAAEVDRWRDITSKMFVPFHDGVISQFEGYEQLLEFDWDGYRARYGDIGRLDLILEAEGDTPNRYKLSKQADTLMLFYLLSAEELRELLAGLGYALAPETVLKTVDYYLARTSQGSTLSRVVDAWILARSDRNRSWSAFTQALEADASGGQAGSTAEGIHLGAMAGTLDIIQRCYTGLEAREGVLWLNPRLPSQLGFIDLNVLYRRQWLGLRITQKEVLISAPASKAGPVRIGVAGRLVHVRPGETHVVALRHARVRNTRSQADAQGLGALVLPNAQRVAKLQPAERAEQHAPPGGIIVSPTPQVQSW